jgi:serine/threonine-protein kinase
MGEVYLAEDTKLLRKVAIKLLPTETCQDEQARKRLVREAQSAATLDHPNICTIHEVGEEEDRGFIVMQYLEGETLSTKIKNGPLELKNMLEIAIQVLDGLGEAHLRGIIHRDIKPQNIMITSRGQAKIMDFGLAKMVQAGSMETKEPETVSLVTELGKVIGTVPYMSPEQLRGEILDPRSDLFSFGSVLYEMVSGKRPFGGNTAAANYSAILTESPPPLERADIPEKMRQVIRKCLEKDRNLRYQSAQELFQDLKLVADQLSRPAPSAESAPSIAVLSFVNMSADPENDYFCDGLAEELINALTKIDRLRVVARTSAFSFKGKNLDVREIGQKLNVDAVLEGSVRKSGNRLRITAQLIKVSDGYHLWSERFDRQMEDIFAIQDEISLAIANALKVKLLGEEKEEVLKKYTENPEAHELYMKGRYFWFKFNPGNWVKAREYFEQALQKDPNFVLAYSGLADSWIAAALFTHPKDVLPKAKETISHALKLDDSVAEVWCSEAAVRFFHDWDFAGCEASSKKGFELNPRYSLGHDLYALNLLVLERFDEAIHENRITLEHDPLSSFFNSSLGSSLFFARKFDEAREQLMKSAELDPGQIWAQMWLLELNEFQKNFSDALKLRQEILTLTGQRELAIEIGEEFHRSGYPGVLRKYLEHLHRQAQIRYITPLDFAAIYVQLGETETALDWLEKAVDDHSMYVTFLKVRPAWDPLRSNPRYKQLLRRIGLRE